MPRFATYKSDETATPVAADIAPAFNRATPLLDDLSLTADFFGLEQARKDEQLESIMGDGLFAANPFMGAPHILRVDRPAGLIAIWHSKVGAVIADDPQGIPSRTILDNSGRRFVNGIVALHQLDLKNKPDYLNPKRYITASSISREAALDEQPGLAGPCLRAEYKYLQNCFSFAIGREPQRRHSLRVQATDTGGIPVAQHVHIDKTESTPANPIKDGFILVKTVHGTKTTEVVPRRMTVDEAKEASVRMNEADVIAAKLGVVPTPADTICLIKMMTPGRVDYNVGAGHRFPTIYANEARLAIGIAG